MRFTLLDFRYDDDYDTPHTLTLCSVAFKGGKDRALLYIQRDMYGKWMIELGFIRII